MQASAGLGRLGGLGITLYSTLDTLDNPDRRPVAAQRRGTGRRLRLSLRSRFGLRLRWFIEKIGCRAAAWPEELQGGELERSSNLGLYRVGAAAWLGTGSEAQLEQFKRSLPEEAGAATAAACSRAARRREVMVQFELSEAQRYRLLLLFIRADTSKEGCLSMQVRGWAVPAPVILGLPTA
eukprot:COSAG02_NODE_113_length_35905_cov_25.229012_10_plen_181_part_00